MEICQKTLPWIKHVSAARSAISKKESIELSESVGLRYGEVVRGLSLGSKMAYRDIQLSYRRSTLGPIWATLTVGLQVSIIALLFSQVFSKDLLEYTRYLAAGMTVWFFISATVNESTQSITSSSAIIKNLKLPLVTYSFRVVVKNALQFAHNLSLVAVLSIFLGGASLTSFPPLILGTALALANLTWISYFLAILTSRFRDISAIISGVMLASFYLTPVFWSVEQISGNVRLLLINLNPWLLIFQPIRLPLIGEPVPGTIWMLTTLLALIGLGLMFATRDFLEKRVAFWV